MKKNSKLCVIVGAYGLGNLGDEAILHGLLHKLQKNNPCERFLVFSYEPDETVHFHHVTARHRNLLDLIKSDKVVIGGGELLGPEMAFKYVVLSLVAKLLGKQVIFHAIGAAANIKSGFVRFFTKLVLNFAVDEISVRDPLSRHQLRMLGVKRSISLEKCPSFYVQPAPIERGREILKNEGVDLYQRPLLGITFSLTYDNRKNEKILEFSLDSLSRISKTSDSIQLVFIPFAKHKNSPQNLERDDLFGEWLRKRLNCKRFMVLRGQYFPSEIMSVIGSMDLEISMRLHPLIFASRMGIPCVGIHVHEKIDGFSKLLRYDVVELEETDKLLRIVKRRAQHVMN